MTSITRTTLASTNKRIDALEGKLDTILEVLTGGQVSAPAEVPVLTVPTVQGTVVSVKDEAPEGLPFRELRGLLKQHKANGLVKPGVTVKEAIAGGLMDSFGRLLGTGTVEQAAANVVVADVQVEAPAKPRTPAQIAAAERLASAPRRADGTITPESEWAAREALAETGKFDRFEIDALVSEHGPESIIAALAIA